MIILGGGYSPLVTVFGNHQIRYHRAAMMNGFQEMGNDFAKTRSIAIIRKTDSRFASSQWETVLLCNDVSHWLGASLESALIRNIGLLINSDKKRIPKPLIDKSTLTNLVCLKCGLYLPIIMLLKDLMKEGIFVWCHRYIRQTPVKQIGCSISYI